MCQIHYFLSINYVTDYDHAVTSATAGENVPSRINRHKVKKVKPHDKRYKKLWNYQNVNGIFTIVTYKIVETKPLIL